MPSLIEAIIVIAKQNPDGFTVEVPSLKPVTSGYICAYEETQNSFGQSGLERVTNHALEHGRVVGGWLNNENRKYYFDSSAVFANRDEAIDFGRKNRQIAIFDLNNFTEIRL
jgi:fructokinase